MEDIVEGVRVRLGVGPFDSIALICSFTLKCTPFASSLAIANAMYASIRLLYPHICQKTLVREGRETHQIDKTTVHPFFFAAALTNPSSPKMDSQPCVMHLLAAWSSHHDAKTKSVIASVW